ncbi:MAG: hypothetical protein IH804_09610 [Planctomycetes bacterium]|nr:hypothetical protein [Planctomycetota bacterium]
MPEMTGALRLPEQVPSRCSATECPAAPGAGGTFDPGTDRPAFIPTASNGEDKEDEDLDFYDDDEEEDPDLDDDADALALGTAADEITAGVDDIWEHTALVRAEPSSFTLGRRWVRIAAHGYTPSARTMAMAALASLWSRALLSSSDAAALVRHGAYQSAVVLIRQAIEHVAAQAALPDDPDAFASWAHEAYARDEASRADEVGLGHFFGGEAIAQDEALELGRDLPRIALPRR